ncbi:transcription initiation factor TFIID subunit 12 [Enteropsectra breve]|nr:transcription initiation factor TFIID subunit 12 [Enteropsectra breve]
MRGIKKFYKSPMANSSTNNHFVIPEKLAKLAKRKIDHETMLNTQSFAEKIITDIVTRSALLAKHTQNNVIDIAEISLIVEKDFDYSFGTRVILPEKNLPTNDHIERMGELSRQK